MAMRENQIESAHNVVMAEFREIERKRDDETVDYKTRVEYAEKAIEFAKSYESHLRAAIREYDSEKLPDDINLMSQVISERVEAAANAHNKRIKNAVTQQGIDLPESCVEQEEASRAIASIKQEYQLRIEMAQDIEQITKEYESALSLMEKVKVINVPVAYDDDENMIEGTENSVDGNFVINFVHPSKQVSGIVSVSVKTEEYKPGAFFRSEVKTDEEGKFRYTKVELYAPDNVGDTVKYLIGSRNLCGPADDIAVSVTKVDSQTVNI